MQKPLAQSARLRVLSLVHVPSIPLYLVAGPCLDVSTDDSNTAGWLNEVLLGNQEYGSQYDALFEPRWEDLGRQSNEGVLLKVEESDITIGVSQKITELLLYAAVESKRPFLPTPPTSSSPERGDQVADPSRPLRRPIKVYALPLSYDLLRQAAQSVNVVTPPLEGPPSAYFLPYELQPLPLAPNLEQKRQSISSRFDDATQKRRKLKGRGGESIAQAMAGIDGPAPRNSLSINVKSESKERPLQSATHSKGREALSRTSSMISTAASDYSRPLSRSESLAKGKRSSLHRVESAISPRDSPTFSESDDTIEAQNKAALIKIVMAGMRLYGLQQRKKKPGAPLATESPISSLHEFEPEDEYKLVYHQTFKSASLTFRKQFSASLIPQEALRDVVDRLLSLFCTNPVESSSHGCDESFGFGTQGSELVGYFDLPTKNEMPPTTLSARGSPNSMKR